MKLTRDAVAKMTDAELLRLGAAIAGEQSSRAEARPAVTTGQIFAETTHEELPQAKDEHPLDRLFRETAAREGVRF